MKFKIVKDLSKSFNPYPKVSDKVSNKSDKKTDKNSRKKDEEFCIMPKSKLYSTVRTDKYCERHEVYFR